ADAASSPTRRSSDLAEAGGKLLAHGLVQLAEDEVVRLVDADLPRALAEVRRLQVVDGLLRPRGHFLVEEARRPAAPVERAAADDVREPGERRRRLPRHAPDFVLGRLGLRRCVVADGEARRVAEALDAGV